MEEVFKNWIFNTRVYYMLYSVPFRRLQVAHVFIMFNILVLRYERIKKL